MSIISLRFKEFLLLGVLATFFSSACTVEGEVVDLKDQDIQLAVFHTADWHSRLIPYIYNPTAPVQQNGLLFENAPFGGIGRLATLLKQERAKADRSLTMDTGDCFQGAPIFNIFSGEPEIRMQTQVKMDAAVAGNHEFDLGIANYVAQYHKYGAYPALAANYDLEDFQITGNSLLGEVIQPYTIVEKEGLKVLIIGLGNLTSLNSIREGGNSIGVTPLEPNFLVQHYIDQLAPYVDVVSVISHLGLNEDVDLVEGYTRYIPITEPMPVNEECRKIKTLDSEVYECKVPGVRGIDFILGGHFHIVLNPPEEAIDSAGRRVPIVHSGAFMQFLGRMDTVFRHASRMDRDPWYGFELVDFKYKPIPIDSRLERDPEVMNIMEPYYWELALNYDLDRPIGFSPAGVTRSAVNGGDSAMGNIVAGSIRTRNRVETDFSLTNSAGIRDNFPAGTITLEMLFNVFPFENTITTFYLSGGEVKEVFDFVASRSTGRGCRSQVQVSGIEFDVRCDCIVNKTGCCVEDARAFDDSPLSCSENIKIGGNPLNINATYEVGGNDYMARGGSGFRMLRKNTTQRDSGISLRTAVEEYLRKQPPCTQEQLSVLGSCLRDSNPNSLACEYDDLVQKYGAENIPCIVQTGVVDSRIKMIAQ